MLQESYITKSNRVTAENRKNTANLMGTLLLKVAQSACFRQIASYVLYITQIVSSLVKFL